MSTRLDHYRVDEAIGAGSYATVHRAVDERLNDAVAIKILAENHSLSPEIRARFIAEGRSLRKVGGGHAVTVYDIGESDRLQPYLVLELADRGSVRDRVEFLWQQGWRATTDDALAFARSLAVAVGAVHRADLVHRDLSPGNLLLTSQGASAADETTRSHDAAVVQPGERLLIADLGMCKDLAMHSGLTVSGGTEGFRPPEQDGPGTVDFRADIWAMSALLGWLVQGSDMPSALSKVIKRGQSDRPKRRQPDTQTWLDEVESALAPPEPETVPAENGSVPDQQSRNENADRRQTQTLSRPLIRRILWILAACAVIAVLVGGVLLGKWAFEGNGEPPSHAASSSIDISGPTKVEVGESATFTAEVHNAPSWSWTLPSHRFIADSKEVTVTPTGAGDAEIILRSQTPDGQDLEARHQFRVVD